MMELTRAMRAPHWRAVAFAACALTLWVWVGGCAATTESIQTPAAMPAQARPTPVPGALTYVVQRGDTLWSIGKHYGVPYREIMRANGMSDPSQLSAGRLLAIPPPATVQTRVPLYPNPRWTHIVVHHSAVANGNAKLIDRAHRKQGFRKGLGYHFVIDNGTSGRRDGQIEVGGRWLRQDEGAHCNAGGMNQHGIGICLIGDFTYRQPTPAQLDALIYLVQQLRSYYGIPATRVVAHRDVPGKNTACPGSRFPWTAFKRHLVLLDR